MSNIRLYPQDDPLIHVIALEITWNIYKEHLCRGLKQLVLQLPALRKHKFNIKGFVVMCDRSR